MDINQFSTPINRTAALVTSQSTSTDLDELGEQRAILKIATTFWHTQHQKGVDGALEKLAELKLEAKACKKKMSIIKAALSETMEHYIIKECRGRFESEEWAVIIHRARQQCNKELGGEL